jgi:hypothetical protein
LVTSTKKVPEPTDLKKTEEVKAH